MMMIPVHVIAFFLATMMVPPDVNQFTIDVQGKRIQWTQQNAGWRAVELPRDDWGTYSVNDKVVIISGEGKEWKTRIEQFLKIVPETDWTKVTEIEVARDSLGKVIQVKREEGKISLVQEKGELFQNPATISWQKRETE